MELASWQEQFEDLGIHVAGMTYDSVVDLKTKETIPLKEEDGLCIPEVFIDDSLLARFAGQSM